MIITALSSEYYYYLLIHFIVFQQISKEVLYGSHSPIHSKHSSGRNTLHSLQGSMSPPMVRSMPSSPSRLAYGGGDFLGKKGMADPGSTTIPHECQPGRVRSRTVFSSSSAILERRDVKPGEKLVGFLFQDYCNEPPGCGRVLRLGKNNEPDACNIQDKLLKVFI